MLRDHQYHLHYRPPLMVFDVIVTSTITWFYPNLDMVSHQIYRSTHLRGALYNNSTLVFFGF